MAKQQSRFAAAQQAAQAGVGSGSSELMQRIFFLIGALIVYRIGTHIPVPGVDPIGIQSFFQQDGQGSIFGVLNLFSGGALERASLLALGVMPYISASIIMQMLTSVHPPLKQLKQEGEAGRRKITKYTKYGTVVLAVFQALGISSAVSTQTVNGAPIVLIDPVAFKVTAVMSLVAGTMFLVWLGEQITDRGIGNGMSLIIFAGIVAGLPVAAGQTASLISEGSLSKAFGLFLIPLVIAVIAFVVLIERAQRRITINYAQRQQGKRMMAAQSSYFPLKLNMAGVIPPIFASSIILFPASMVTFFAPEDVSGIAGALRNVASYMTPGNVLYSVVFVGLIFFFAFFYTALTFDPSEIADNLKKQGATVPGMRPGKQTASYIDSVVGKLTFVGAFYLAFVCLIPEILQVKFNVPFYFGGTSLLIIVVVIMDLVSQVQSHLMSSQYSSLMKKTNLTSSKKVGKKR
ncbi:MAG: preprotein translocase subunit SecY [Arenicella sp.]